MGCGPAAPADGTELIENGVSRAMGEPRVGYGTPGSTTPGAGPLYSGSSAANTEQRLIYVLSVVFRIVAPPGGLQRRPVR